MKAISLLQPWATLWVLGIKGTETRSWHTWHRGRLMVHASKGKAGREDFARILQVLPLNLIELLPTDVFDDLPFGGIIGSVNLVNCVQMTVDVIAEQSDVERAAGNWQPNRFAWVAESGEAFKTIVPCKGSLSIWTVPPEVQRLCEAA